MRQFLTLFRNWKETFLSLLTMIGLAAPQQAVSDSTQGKSMLEVGLSRKLPDATHGDSGAEIGRNPVIDEPVRRKPFRSKEVSFENGAITLSGTLTWPRKKGRHPAVILISGSGPQDRNETILGFQLFKIIADHLSANGIAVLRFDDRGFGKSTGKGVMESTTAELATDVLAAAKFLAKQDQIDPEQIGLLGHSEGGIIAPIVATRDTSINFAILMAGTGVTGHEILLAQTELIMRANKAKEEDITEQLEVLKKLGEVYRETITWDEMETWIRDKVKAVYQRRTAEEQELIGSMEEFVAQQVEASKKSYYSVWIKYFAVYDPVPALEKMSCPVLLLFGGKDLQVPVSQNRAPMEAALARAGNQDVETLVFEEANHLFQTAGTGSPFEYMTLPKQFVPGFLDGILGWTLKRVKIVK